MTYSVDRSQRILDRQRKLLFHMQRRAAWWLGLLYVHLLIAIVGELMGSGSFRWAPWTMVVITFVLVHFCIGAPHRMVKLSWRISPIKLAPEATDRKEELVRELHLARSKKSDGSGLAALSVHLGANCVRSLKTR